MRQLIKGQSAYTFYSRSGRTESIVSAVFQSNLQTYFVG